MIFQHFLLTNFFIKKPEWQGRTDVTGNRAGTIDWLEHRVKLFEKYCLPSIKNQTSQQFRWLLFFDVSTPDRYKSLAEFYRVQCPVFAPVYVEDGKKETIFREIRKRVHSKTEYLLTTRIDNDDGFALDAIETIQNFFFSQHAAADTILVNFLNGCLLHIPEEKAFKLDEKNNPFMTMIEKRSEMPFKTVWCDQHRLLWKHAPVAEIVGKPFWLRVTHDKNLVNRPEGDPCTVEEVRKFFPYA